jgi:hypothetical protein
MRSQYFRAMFSSGMKEARNGHVRLHYGSRSVESMLEYFYTDGLLFESFAAEEPPLELLVTANQIGLDRFKALAEAKISEMLSIGIALRESNGYASSLQTVVSVAEQHNCAQLLASCIYFCLRCYPGKCVNK